MATANPHPAVITIHGSDVRLLELSLQPTDNGGRAAGTTTYTWNYRRLLFGQPVRVDVLGIAPIDRLGELTWLGPLGVIAFGLLAVFAVVRFRNVLKDTRDTTFILWAIVQGMGAGTYRYATTIIGATARAISHAPCRFTRNARCRYS